MGRFGWYALRGKRDEGVLVIVAYRVCHKASDNPGPFTAYQQQHTLMRAAGMANPNPRKQILSDMMALIKLKQTEGLRPIVMMDPNGDYIAGKDNELLEFIQDCGLLCDPFYDKFGFAPPTYIHCTKRLDYIYNGKFKTTVKHFGWSGFGRQLRIMLKSQVTWIGRRK